MIKNQRQKGVVLLIAFLTMSMLFILGSYLLTFTLTDFKILKSQEGGVRTYYLAEAGINEAIWKLKNDDITSDGDDAWKLDFIDSNKNPYFDGTYWQSSFSRNFGGGSYTVAIKNSSRGKGEIISTATLPLSGGRTGQRIIKTTVFKALASPTKDSAVFSGGQGENIDINFSNLKVEGGNLFSNNNLNISLSTVQVYDNPGTEDILEGQIFVVNNYNNNFSSITAQAICAKNSCAPKCSGYAPGTTQCPPAFVSVPIVNFDSSDLYSFKYRARLAQDSGQCQVLCNGTPCSNNCIYPAKDFENLLWQVGQAGTLTLNNAITYVTGPVEIKGGRSVIVNGVLVADDNIYIGEKYSWTRQGRTDSGFSQITVNRPGENLASGILTKRKISFDVYCAFQNIIIEGVIYANDEIRIVSVPKSFEVVGGIIGRKVSLSSVWQWLNVVLNNDIIIYGLGYKIDGEIISPDATFSPVITIEHWEESY